MLGLVAVRREDYDAAERLHHDSLAIWRSLKSDSNVSVGLHDLGALEEGRGDYGAAESYFREALSLAEQIQFDEGVLGGYLGLGNIAIKQKNFAEARNWLEKALPLAREIGRQDYIAEVQRGFAEVQEAEGRPDQALASALESLVIEEKLHSEYLPRTRKLVERLKEATGEQ
jgi:tetratricopeptide (TPR) repeat protein